MSTTHVCQRNALKKLVQNARRQVSDVGKVEEVLATDASLDAAVFVFWNFHL